MTKNFVFENIDESIKSEALYLGKSSYLFDMDTGEILFKTKYRYEEFSHYCLEFAFFIGKYVFERKLQKKKENSGNYIIEYQIQK